MRKGLVIMGLFSMLGMGATADQQSKPGQPAGSVAVLTVNGMACGACAARVEKTAKELSGVNAAIVNQPKGTAEITYDASRTSAEAIARWISEKTPFKAELAPKRK